MLVQGTYSFRQFLEHLDKKGKLVKVKEPVDLIYGVTKEARKYDRGPAVLLENIKGFDIPIAFGIFNQRGYVADLLQVDEDALPDAIIERAQQPVLPEYISSKAPSQEVVIENPDLLKEIPFPKHYERDAGRYCTSGVILAKDVDGPGINVSFARMQICSDKILVMINEWRHLITMFLKAEALGKNLPVAVIIGPEPILWLEGAMPDGLAGLEANELAVAGGLARAPLSVTKAITSDLPIPAYAEIVIEGEMIANRRELEGPFGDYPKVYDQPPRYNPVIVPSVITRRKDAIYHDIIPAMYEHFWLGGIPREADLMKNLRRMVRCVRKVHLTPGSVCRFHLVVQIEKSNDLEPREVIMAAMSPSESSRDIKIVTVVDSDINPFDPEDVEWAVTTRVQWDRDALIVPRLPSALDPAAMVHTTVEALKRGEICGAKIGVDATKPLYSGEMLHIFDKVDIP